MSPGSPQSETTHGVPAALWGSLFHKFAAIVRLDPWAWLAPQDFFGIRLPAFDEPVFIHFDAVGDAPGVTLVFGWRGEGLHRHVLAGIDHVDMRAYEIPLVRACLRPLDDLTPVERALAEAAGCAPDAHGRLPVFVRYRPGWMPWTLDADDVRRCEAVLNQTLGVLLRAETDKALVARADPATVWVRAQDGKTGGWREGWERLRPFQDHAPGPRAMPSDDLIAQVNALPETLASVEADLGLVPKMALVNAEIVKKCAGGRLPLGYLFAVADAAAAAPLGSCVFYPCDDLDGLWNVVPESLLRVFTALGRRPREIAVSSHVMQAFLRPLQTRIHFKLTFHEHLPRFDAILERTRALVDENLAKATHAASR